MPTSDHGSKVQEGPASESLLRYRLALLAAGFLWSLGGVFIKKLPVSAFGITFYRSLFAALCLLPLLRGRTRPRWGDALVAVLFYVLLLVLYVASTQGTSAANAILLQYTAPLYALVLGPLFFREPYRREDALAMGVAMVGMAILLVGNFTGGQRWALAMGAGSGAMFGFFMLWMRRMRYADPFAVTALDNAGVALIAAIVLWWLRPSELRLIPHALSGQGAWQVPLTLAVMGCVQIAIPYVLFSYGLTKVPAVEAGLLALVEPLLNPVWVALFAGEIPSRATLFGGGLILFGLAARYLLFGRRGSRSVATEAE